MNPPIRVLYTRGNPSNVIFRRGIYPFPLALCPTGAIRIDDDDDDPFLPGCVDILSTNWDEIAGNGVKSHLTTCVLIFKRRFRFAYVFSVLSAVFLSGWAFVFPVLVWQLTINDGFVRCEWFYVHLFAVPYKITKSHFGYSRKRELRQPIFEISLWNFNAALHILFGISPTVKDKLNRSKFFWDS